MENSKDMCLSYLVLIRITVFGRFVFNNFLLKFELALCKFTLEQVTKSPKVVRGITVLFF